MLEQVLDVENVARHDAARALRRWARSGRWSRVSQRVSFFLSAALAEAQRRYSAYVIPRTTTEEFLAPPWTKAEAEWLSLHVMEEWEFSKWVERWADAEFQSQERTFRSYHS